MPRSVRSRTPIALLGAVLLLGACSVDDGSGPATPSPSAPSTTASPTSPAPPTTSDVPSETPTPEPDPAPTPTSAVRVAATGEATVAAFTGSRAIVTTPRAVAGYDLRGRQVWRLKRSEDLPSRVTGTSETAGVVVVSWDKPRSAHFYPPLFVRVLDARTGVELWRDDSASYARAAGGIVFTALCTGEQDRQLGDCTLSARDPRTGATRWSVPTYASTRVPMVRDDVLVTESYPGQTSASWRVRDLATGAGISPEVGDASPTSTLDGFVSASHERPGEDGCFTTVRYLDLAGDELWKRRFPVRFDDDEPDECIPTWVTETPTDGPVNVTAYRARSRVLDPATGRTLLDADNQHTVMAVADGVAVVAEGSGGYEQVGAGVSLRTGRTIWPTAGGDPLTYETWAIAGTRALRSREVDLDDCVTEDVDLRTGRVLHSYPGALAGSGPGWVATASSCDGYGKDHEVAVYRLRGADAVAPF